MEVATASTVAPRHHHNTRRRHGRVKEEDAEAPPAVAACSASSQEDSEYVSEDEQIQHLDKSGALEQVVGSQSILSQELHNLGETNLGVGGLSQDIAGFSQQSAVSSSRGMDSQQLAHKYGLLSQDPMECDDGVQDSDVEEEENGQDEENENGDNVDDMDYQLSTRHLEPSFSQESSSSQGSFSQNDKIGTLLEAVQMFQSQDEEEAEKLRKIKATKKSKGTSKSGSNYMNSGSSHLGWSVASPEPAKENMVRGTRSSSRINSGSYKPKANPKMPSLPLATRKAKKGSPKKKATAHSSKSKTVCAKKTVVAKKTIASQMPPIVLSDPHPAILTDEALNAVTVAKSEAVVPTKAKEPKDEGPVICLRKRKKSKRSDAANGAEACPTCCRAGTANNQ